MKGDVGERRPSRQTWLSCESPSCSLMLWWSFSLWHVTCQSMIRVGWTSARSLENITLGWNLMQRNTCGLGTPRGRELDSLEPVFLHPLPKNSQQNPEVWKMGREEAGRKTTLPVFGTVFLCALWLSMCSLLKWSSSSLKQGFSRYLQYRDKVRECVATVKYPSSFW